MAINLWKLGGQPTSYNPLPVGSVSFVPIGVKEYIVTFKARRTTTSITTLRVWDNHPYDVDMTYTLGDELKEYTLEFSSKNVQNLYIGAAYSHSVYITDIELVEKPLGKATINGISGEVEDWEQGGIGSFADYYETTNRIRTKRTKLIPVEPNQTYTLEIKGDKSIYNISLHEYDSQGKQVKSGYGWLDKITFTTQPKTAYLGFPVRRLDDATLTPKEIEQVKPMLYLGTLQGVPYEQKRGERMVEPVVRKNLFDGVWKLGSLTGDGGQHYDVAGYKYSEHFIKVEPNETITFSKVRYYFMYDYNKNFIGISNKNNERDSVTVAIPVNCHYIRFNMSGVDLNDLVQLERGTTATPYEPFAVQVNKHADGLVPRKNLISNTIMLYRNQYIHVNGSLAQSSSGSVTIDYLPIDSNTNYVLSTLSDDYYVVRTAFYDVNKKFISESGTSYQFKTPLNAYYLRTCFANVYDKPFDEIQPQLERGSTPTPYQPYQLVNKPAPTGLVMDGKSYIQLPSMTMDSIEIDCLIDNNQPAFQYLNKIVDARNGLINGWFDVNGGIGSSWGSVSGFAKGERTKITLDSNNVFTDNVNIFSDFSGASSTKGIIYSIKCYLDGQVVWHSDFTKPHEGNVIYNGGEPENLLPSFDSGGWSLHPEFKVIGSNIGEIHANGTLPRNNHIFVPVEANQKYRLEIEGQRTNGIQIYAGLFDAIDGVSTSTPVYGVDYGAYEFTTSSSTKFVKVVFQNKVAGVFIFQRLRLIKLNETIPLFLPSFHEWGKNDSAIYAFSDNELRLNRTGSGQTAYTVKSCKPNTDYIFSYNGDMGVQIQTLDISGNTILSTVNNWTPNNNILFTTSSNSVFIRILFGRTINGNFTAKNPKLVERVDIAQGQIVGNAQPQTKKAKRNTYNKR